MKFLLTNDDGIEAPGLATLQQAITGFGEFMVVAPADAISGCSHQVNTHRPLHVTKVNALEYAVDGTPADCIRLGLIHLMPDVDWVMAGVNDGGNLGVDVYMSGTVAAAREASFFGKPAVAFSQYRRKRKPFDWSAAVPMVQRVFEHLRLRPLKFGVFWNVNFPDLDHEDVTPEIVICPIDSSHLPVRYNVQSGMLCYQGSYHERARKPGADVDVCFSGRIAVTEVPPSWPV